MAIFSFDQTGRNPANRIRNEVQDIASVNGINLNYLVPHNAPFYGTTLVVFDEATQRALEEGVDYILTHKFQEAFDNLAMDVYGTITFLDPNRNGRFILSYQTLGGDFVTSVTQALEHGMGILADLINADWTDLVGVPPTFPPTHHTQPLTDLDAVGDVINIMQEIRDALADPYNSLTLGDVTDLDAEFITPFLNELANLSGTLAAKVWTNRLPHEMDYFPGNATVDLGALNPNIWTDVGLSVTVQQDGRYDISWSLPSFPVWPLTTRHQSRFVVDGSPITESYSKETIASLPAGSEVKLQVRVTDSVTTSFVVARDGQGASLKIIRIDN